MAKINVAQAGNLLSSDAMNELRNGSNAGNIVDVLTYPLHSTVTLATGEKEFTPFSLNRSEMGNDGSLTNVQIGNRVPSKQAWDVKAIKVSLTAPTVLTDVQIAKLNNFLFRSVLSLEIDDSPKFEKTLSSIVGATTFIQADATTGSSNLNATYTGTFKLDEKLYMGAETQFNFTIRDFETAGVDADLDGVLVRLELDRKLIRLV